MSKAVYVIVIRKAGGERVRISEEFETREEAEVACDELQISYDNIQKVGG